MSDFNYPFESSEKDPDFLRKLALEISLAEERQKRLLAEDLHDHVGQALALLKMKLLELRSNSAFCGFESTIEDMRRLLDQTISYTRTLTFELSPPVLYQLGLGPALESLVEGLKKKSGKKIQYFDNSGNCFFTLTDDTKIALYRASHEFLMNAIKHADAPNIKLSLKMEENSLSVTIEDDGIGFDIKNVSGFGLFSSKERLTCLGVGCKIESSINNGTKIILYLGKK